MKRFVIIILSLIFLVIGIRYILSAEGLIYVWKGQNFWLKKANFDEKVDVLILGDDKIAHAVDPKFFEEEGKQAFSFTFENISFTLHYLSQAEKLLKPKTIIVMGLTAQSLTSFHWDHDLRINEVQGPLILHQILRWLRIQWPEFPLQPYLKWRGYPKSDLFPEPQLNIFHDSGWVESPLPITNDFTQSLERLKKIKQYHPVDSTILEQLLTKATQWVSNGHKVYFFWACFESEICKEELKIVTPDIRAGLFQRLNYAGASELSLSGPYKTYDGEHLNSTEAQIFSKDLTQAMANDLDL